MDSEKEKEWKEIQESVKKINRRRTVIGVVLFVKKIPFKIIKKEV